MLINTAGGLTGGDRLDGSRWSRPRRRGHRDDAGACESVYEAIGGSADVDEQLIRRAERAGSTGCRRRRSCSSRSRLNRRLDVELGRRRDVPRASKRCCSAARAMGESGARRRCFDDRWRIRATANCSFMPRISRLVGRSIWSIATRRRFSPATTPWPRSFTSPTMPRRGSMRSRAAIGEQGGGQRLRRQVDRAAGRCRRSALARDAGCRLSRRCAAGAPCRRRGSTEGGAMNLTPREKDKLLIAMAANGGAAPA